MHNLAINPKTGQEAFLNANRANNERAWHGLGVELDKPATVAEALQMAGLDFVVEKRPVLFAPDGTTVREVPNQFVTYRTDTNAPLGVIGKKYVISQNTNALSFFDSIVGEHQAVIETAGVLGGGRQTFITAKMPAHVFVPGDEIEPYVILLNSHDGSGAIQLIVSPVRIVCANTMAMALRNHSNRIRIAHTKSADSRIKEAGRIMGIYDQLQKEMSEAMTSLTTKKVTEKQVDDYIKTLFKSATEDKGKETSTRATNIRNDVKAYLYGESGGQQMFAGTAYQAYQGITGFFQNVKEYRGTEGKFSQLILGEDAKVAEKAFALALQF